MNVKITDEYHQQDNHRPSGIDDVSRTNTAVIVITDPPQGIEIGIDCMTYETGPNFRGFQQVPEGLQFIHHSSGMGNR